MKKIFIISLIIFIILFSSFNICYSVTLKYLSNNNNTSLYNLELIEMFNKTIKSANKNGSKSQRLFKLMENLFLLLEASDTRQIFSFQSLFIEANYEYNSLFDIKNKIINEQNIETSNISKLSLSGTTMDNNGCEVIAVNNALKLMGQETSMANLVKQFQKNNIVICDFLIKGFLGSNPYSIGRALKNNQIKYDVISLDELNEKGLYIVSYWNSLEYTSMLHTVTLRSDGNGNYITYNLHGNGNVSLKHPSEYIDSYIIGYKLYY